MSVMITSSRGSSSALASHQGTGWTRYVAPSVARSTMKGYDRQVWVRAAPEQAMCHTSVCAKTVRCGNAERCTRSEHNYAAGPSALERSVAGKQRTQTEHGWSTGNQSHTRT